MKLKIELDFKQEELSSDNIIRKIMEGKLTAEPTVKAAGKNSHYAILISRDKDRSDNYSVTHRSLVGPFDTLESLDKQIDADYRPNFNITETIYLKQTEHSLFLNQKA